MDKYFTKKESETLINLFSSKDFENYKLVMNLIFTHKRYKSISKRIIVRYPRIYIKEYYNISPKYSFKQLVQIYNRRIKDKSWDIYDSVKFFRIISDFVKERTK